MEPVSQFGQGAVRGRGRYQLGRALGDHHAVYEAQDLKNARAVIFKRLAEDVDMTYLEWEVRSLKSLECRNIVSVLDLGEDTGGPYLVMRRLDRDLAQHLGDGLLDDLEVCDMGMAVASALEAAHQVGVIHGLINPHNILLSRKGNAKLSDFGYAHRPDFVVQKLSAYLAPEQKEGRAADGRTDIYSLCAVLYRCVTGQAPTTIDERLIPQAFRPQLLKGLSRNPARRYPNAAAVKRALLEVKQQLLEKDSEEVRQPAFSDLVRGTLRWWMMPAIPALVASFFWFGFSLLGSLSLGLVLAAFVMLVCAATLYSMLQRLRSERTLGDRAYEASKLEDALVPYLTLLQVCNDDPELHYRLGEIYQQQGDLLRASVHYRKCLGMQPRRIKAHRNLARVFRGMDKKRESEHHYRKILKLTNGHGEAHYNLGVILAKQRPDKAIDHFRRALEADPNHPKAHGNLATLLLRKGKPERAVRHFERALKLDPWNIHNHNNLAALLDDMGESERAERLYRTALKLDAQCAKVHNNLGLLMHKQERDKEAEYHFRTALDIEPDNPLAHKNLADMFSHRGSQKDAEYHYRLALKLDPTYSDCHRKLADLLRGQGRKKAAARHYLKARGEGSGLHVA